MYGLGGLLNIRVRYAIMRVFNHSLIWCTKLILFLFSVDSGGQYFDGTTDITRTFHYGTPSAKQVKSKFREVLILTRIHFMTSFKFFQQYYGKN